MFRQGIDTISPYLVKAFFCYDRITCLTIFLVGIGKRQLALVQLELFIILTPISTFILAVSSVLPT